MLSQALTAHPIPVVVGGATYTIGARPAGPWLLAMLTEPWEYAVVPGMLDATGGPLIKRLLVGGVDDAELSKAAHDAVAAASGRTWWETMRLVGVADQESGVIVGQLTIRGIDADRVTLAAWCAAVYTLSVQGMDEKQRTKFDMALALPPSSEDPDEMDDWDATVW